jgi:hypothetical protein
MDLRCCCRRNDYSCKNNKFSKQSTYVAWSQFMFNFYNCCINKSRIKCSLNWGKSEVSNTLVYRWFLGKWSKARLFPRFSYARCIKNATNCVLKARLFIYVKCATFTCTNYNVPGTSSVSQIIIWIGFHFSDTQCK